MLSTIASTACPVMGMQTADALIEGKAILALGEAFIEILQY